MRNVKQQSYTMLPTDITMLAKLATYHGLSRSAILRTLIRDEHRSVFGEQTKPELHLQPQTEAC